MKTISDPGGPFETLEEYTLPQQDIRKSWIPPRAESAMQRPVFREENSPISTIFTKKPRGQGVWYSHNL